MLVKLLYRKLYSQTQVLKETENTSWMHDCVFLPREVGLVQHHVVSHTTDTKNVFALWDTRVLTQLHLHTIKAEKV